MAEKPKHTPESVATKVVKALLKVKPKGSTNETLENPVNDRTNVTPERRESHPSTKTKSKANPTTK
jgi:hypothetical protein